MTAPRHHRPRPRVIFLLPALALVGMAGCGLVRNDTPEEEQVPERSIEEVQEAYTPGWMELDAVVGTGIGLCEAEEGADPPREPCIRVFLSEPSPEAEEAIPEEVEGHRVELVVTGPFRPRVPPDTGNAGR